MTQEEATIYLPIDEDNDLQDAYDAKLFELKQFFLSRFPMSKLINARLTKFQKVEEAFAVLGGELSDGLNADTMVLPDFSSLHDLYIWYNQEKNSIRLRLSSSQSYNDASIVLNEYLRVTEYYAKHWQIPVGEEDVSGIKIGVEPNPMDIQAALKELSNIEKLDSKYILTLPNENSLKSEAKRLSLWLNFESNE